MANGKFQQFMNRMFDPGPNVTERSIEQNRMMADALMSQGSPQIQHPLQGLAHLAQAMNAQAYRQRAQRGEQALEKQRAQQIGNLLNNLSLDPQGRQLLESLGPDMQREVASTLAVQQLVPEDPKVSRIGQRVVTLPGQEPFEAEVFWDQDAGEMFIETERGRVPLMGQQVTTPVERQETGPPGSFGRTANQVGEDVQAFQDAVIGGVSAVQSASDLLEIAQANPESLGAPGTILRVGNEFVRTADSLGRMLGISDLDADRSLDRFTFNGFSGRFREAAVESQAFRSGVYGIAFAAAVAEQGTRPTDKDIQAFIDQIAGSTADPQAFARTIQQFVTRLDRRLRSTATIKTIPEDAQRAAFGELDSALERFNSFYAPSNENSQAIDLGGGVMLEFID